MAVKRSRRVALDEPARLHPNDWCSLEVQLLDCSETGFRAACEAAVRVGSRVVIELPGLGPVGACVAWRSGNQFAARFEVPIDLASTKLYAINEEAMLARLLRERAAAEVAGRADEEKRLRMRIRQTLPVRKAAGG